MLWIIKTIFFSYENDIISTLIIIKLTVPTKKISQVMITILYYI